MQAGLALAVSSDEVTALSATAAINFSQLL